MKSIQCGWRSFAIVGLAVLGLSTVAGAADGARVRTAENALPSGSGSGSVMGQPDLRGPDTTWVDTSLAPPTQNLHPPTFVACTGYTDKSKFDTDNPGLDSGAQFEDYNSTVPGHTSGQYIFGCSGWAMKGPGQSACWAAADIVKGIEARENPPTRGNSGLAQFGAGFQGAGSNGVVANFFVDTWVVNFNDPVNGNEPNLPAVKPTAVRSPFTMEFFGSGNTVNTITLSDARTIDLPGLASPGGNFFGVCCDTDIVKMVLSSGTGQAEGYDDVGFGAKTSCNLEAPVTLEDLHIGQEILGAMLEAIEAKLDNFQCSGGGGGGTR